MGIYMHIALSRTDNIGDLLFTLPLASFLKKNIPNARITLIARSYVKDIADAADYIDEFISYEDLIKLNIDESDNYIKKCQIDSIVILKKNKYILDLAKRTKIPHIVAHLKNYFWHSFSLNPLRWQIVNVNFGPKKETLHYAQKCLKFLNFYSIPYKVERKELLHSLKLNVKDFPKTLKFLNNKKINLVLHLGTNGNTSEWPLSQFELLIKRMPKNVNILLTGTLEEKKKFAHILNNHLRVVDLFGKLSVAELLCLLKHVDGLVANATGPLHLAAALGTKVIGLYPSRPVVNSKRWGPLGKHVSVISAPTCPLSEKNKKCECMGRISVDEVLNHIKKIALKNKIT
jgi:heptosyltransferase-3